MATAFIESQASCTTPFLAKALKSIFSTVLVARVVSRPLSFYPSSRRIASFAQARTLRHLFLRARKG